MSNIVLTVLGNDQPGLIDALAEIVHEHGGNWEESQMAQLCGKFAGIVRVRVPDDRAADLIAALGTLRARELLHVTAEIADAPDAHSSALPTWSLDLTGEDHPGIVHDVTHTLASHGVNVEYFESETRPASMAGHDLFHARARLRATDDAELDRLRDALEALANELMVDIELDDQPSSRPSPDSRPSRLSII